MTDYKILPLRKSDLNDLILFSNQQIGKNYYTKSDGIKMISDSKQNEIYTSFLLKDNQNNIKGIRLSLSSRYLNQHFHPPQITLQKWATTPQEVGYFKSLFLHPHIQNMGWGQRLSQLSIDSFKKLNYKAILAHSWKESPHNSSLKYLSKLGFNPLKEHPLFWSTINYKCIRCKAPPCQCTAVEMILYL